MSDTRLDIEKKVKLYIRKYIFESQEEFSRPLSKLLQRCEEHYLQERNLEKFASELERYFGTLKGKKILEIGSGSGSRAVALALKGAKVYGIEPNRVGVIASYYRSKRYDSIKTAFMVGIGENLSFSNNSFDLILTNSVLEHVQNIDKVLSETFRVLKKDGFTYHHTENNLWPRENHYRIFWPPLCPKRLARVYVKLRRKNPGFLSNLNYITPFSLKRRLKKAGFSDIRDLNSENVIEKFNHPERINPIFIKKIIKLITMFKLNRSLGKLAAKVGIYPSTVVVARKSDNNI